MTPIPPYRRPYFNTQPEYLFPKYASTVKRAPSQPLVVLPHTLSEVTAPVFGYGEIKPSDSDLTKQHKGEPLGERIVVSGRVLDENGRPVPGILVEIWQANAAGRYNHRVDQHDAPIDPHFTGAGRLLTDKDGHYRFMTIRPGEYPWRNHHNAWRPAHIHFSLFGQGIGDRLSGAVVHDARDADAVRIRDRAVVPRQAECQERPDGLRRRRTHSPSIGVASTTMSNS